jgi:hypothetical protein
MDRDNEPFLDSPQEYPCRFTWDGRTITTEQGIQVTTDGRIAIPATIPARSLVWEGLLAEWDNTGGQTIYEVVSSSRADDIQGKNTRREYDLMRFRGTLPDSTPEPYE